MCEVRSFMAETMQGSDWLDFSDLEEEDTPDASESPAPTDDAPAPDTTADDAEDADADDDAPDAPAAPEAASPSPDATADPAPPDAPKVSETPTPAPEPYIVRSHRKEVPLEGVTLGDDGMKIAPVSVPRVKDLLQRGVAYETEAMPRIQRLERENQYLQKKRSAREAHAETIITEMDKILDGGPESAAGFFEDYWNRRAIIKAEAIKAEAEEIRSETRRESEPDPQEYQEQLTTNAQRLVADRIHEYIAAAGGLPADDVKALIDRYTQRAGSFVVQMPHDDPENGLRRGDPAVHFGWLQNEVGYEIRLRAERVQERKAREAAEQKQAEIERKAKERKAAERNAQKLGAAGQQQRATTRANPKGDPAKASGPKNMAELLASLDEDDD